MVKRKNTMPEESTPLVAKVKGLVHHEKVQRAQEVAAEKAKAVHASFERGSFSLLLLVQLGALGLISLALKGLLHNISLFLFAKAIMEVFTLALGYIIMALESRLLMLPQVWTKTLLKYAPFLKFIWGRGILYFFSGTLQMVQGSFLDIIIGLYLMAVGVIFATLGYMTAKKLKTVSRRKVDMDSLRSKFDVADTEKSGLLDLGQFSALVDDLDFGLSRREKEIAFLRLDIEDRGSISFEEFKSWFDKVDEVAPIL